MAGSGIQINKRRNGGGGGTGNGTSINDFKLIPNEVTLSNSDPSDFYLNSTGSPGNEGVTNFRAKKGYMHICRYGTAGSPTIRIEPPTDGTDGDWFAITDGMGIGVQLGWTVNGMSKHPIEILGGGSASNAGSKAYFHYNGGKWILANYYDSQEANSAYKLIPESVWASGTGFGWDSAADYAPYVPKLNALNKCQYGHGGNTPIRIVFPPTEGNQGKWFGVQQCYSAVPVILPINGAGSFYPELNEEDGAFPSVYYHCTQEGWQLQSTNVTRSKLIPKSVWASGSGAGWDTPNPFAHYTPKINALNKCSYGYGGSTPIRITFPDSSEKNHGKWFGIQMVGGVSVFLPVEGLSGLFDPILTTDDGIKPTVYYHCTNEGWQLQSSNVGRFATKTYVDARLAAKADLVGGFVPSSQLPSYVDDILEYNNLASFPGTGDAGKIYIAKDSGKQYRWSGSAYIQITNGFLASTADLPDSTNKRYQTDAQSANNDATSSIQTQLDEKQSTLTDVTLGTIEHNFPEKNTAIDADEITFLNSASSFVKVRTTLVNFWTNYLYPKILALFIRKQIGTYANRLALTGVADGDLFYQTDMTVGLYLRQGGVWVRTSQANTYYNLVLYRYAKPQQIGSINSGTVTKIQNVGGALSSVTYRKWTQSTSSWGTNTAITFTSNMATVSIPLAIGDALEFDANLVGVNEFGTLEIEVS